MLPQINRLPLRFSRSFVEIQGQSFHSPLFTLSISPSQLGATAPTRFAFIISKKIAKFAVDRNLLKRKLVANIHPSLPKILPGFDVILYAKHSLLTADATLLNSEIIKILQKAKLLDQSSYV
jgi:ribonuclease P protein component